MNLPCYGVIRLSERPRLRSQGPANRRDIWRINPVTIPRWDPFREVVALQNRVNSLFRDLNEGENPAAAASFVPAVDI